MIGRRLDDASQFGFGLTPVGDGEELPGDGSQREQGVVGQLLQVPSEASTDDGGDTFHPGPRKIRCLVRGVPQFGCGPLQPRGIGHLRDAEALVHDLVEVGSLLLDCAGHGFGGIDGAAEGDAQRRGVLLDGRGQLLDRRAEIGEGARLELPCGWGSPRTPSCSLLPGTWRSPTNHP